MGNLCPIYRNQPIQNTTNAQQIIGQTPQNSSFVNQNQQYNSLYGLNNSSTNNSIPNYNSIIVNNNANNIVNNSLKNGINNIQQQQRQPENKGDKIIQQNNGIVQ